MQKKNPGEGHSHAALVGSVLLVLCAVVLSAFWSVAVCVSTTQGGSVREAACSVPQLGAWLPPIVVAVVVTLAVGLVIRGGRFAGRQSWALALVPALAVMLVPVVLLLLPGSATAKDAGFAAYAETQLTSVPGSWMSGDDVLVVPGEEVGESEGTVVPADRVGELVALPARAFEPMRTWAEERAGALPQESGSMLVADRGPAHLACTQWPGQSGCTVSVGHLTEDGAFVYDFGVGSDDFQSKGSKMEVFTIPQYAPGRSTTLVLAGGPASVERAEVVLDDGTRVPARVTRAVGQPTGSLYFAQTAGTPVRVVTYRADGTTVEDHALRECVPGESCEIR